MLKYLEFAEPVASPMASPALNPNTVRTSGWCFPINGLLAPAEEQIN